MGKNLTQDWKGLARSRVATGALLLVLMGHAFVASSTHIHRLANSPAPGYSGAVVSANEDTRNAPPVNGHAECIICRLQRNFVSDLQQTIPAIAAPLAAALVFEAIADASVLGVQIISPSGRAPPQA